MSALQSQLAELERLMRSTQRMVDPSSKSANCSILQRLQERQKVYFGDAAAYSTVFFSRPSEHHQSPIIGSRVDPPDYGLTAVVEVFKDMRAKLEEIPVMKRLGVLITVAPVAAPDAGAFRLTMNGGNFLRVEMPAALCVSDAPGHLVKTIAQGARVPRGGTSAHSDSRLPRLDQGCIYRS